jgi:hypothetical protein
MADTKDEPVKVPTLWLYKGYEYYNEKEGLLHAFERLTIGVEGYKRTGDFAHFLKKNMKRDTLPFNCYPGAIFEFETSNPEKSAGNTRSIFFGSKSYKGKWFPPEEAEVMYLASQAAEHAAQARNLIQKDRADTRMMKSALRSLARQYNDLGTIEQKIAFELLVIQRLRGYEI